MALALRYLYRDAANYKAERGVILAGSWSPDEIARFRAAVATAARGAGVDPTTFSPVDLGLPAAQWQMWAIEARNENDHVFNELLEVAPSSASPTVSDLDAAELLRRAEHCAEHGYDITRAADLIGIDA